MFKFRRRRDGYQPLGGLNGFTHSHPRRYLRSFIRLATATLIILVTLIVLTPVVIPSYTRRPNHYSGTNPHNETVFIAANIVDENLIRGPWGQAVLELIDIVGHDRVFLSVYENDSGAETKAALRELAEKLKCNSSIVSGHIDLTTFPSVQILPDQHVRRRITYLAEVRNRALRPLDGQFEFNVTTVEDTPFVPFEPISIRFDKLLFLNDIVFSAKDAADLLFATNADADGRTNYQAACAMDFINAFKFYDTFASRDAEGYRSGIPFFPWFATTGRAISREAVLSQTDAVPVRSCWGGMVAFEAKWFQPQISATPDDFTQSVRPLRFRAEDELFWDASECCLIHADLDTMASRASGDAESIDKGIYINPYIRVAYDARSFSWLEFTRRFERLYTFPHWLANHVAGRPLHQERRDEVSGERVAHQEWTYDDHTSDSRRDPYEDTTFDDIPRYGHWVSVHRIAKPGGFCGYRLMLTLKDHWVEGEKHWQKIEPPPGRRIE